MRARDIVGLLIVAAGCGGERPACDALMRCASTVNPYLVEDLSAAYGEDGRCWAEQDPAACEQACTDELVALWIPSGSPMCDPEPVTGEPMLSEPAFAAWYWTFQCELYQSCLGFDACSDQEPPTTFCFGGTFDPDQAAACLADPPRCVDGPYRPYTENSEPCGRVCTYDNVYSY